MGISAIQRRDFVRTLVTVYDELHENAGPPKDQVAILQVRQIMKRAPVDVVIHTASLARDMFQWFSITGIMDPSFKRPDAEEIIEESAKQKITVCAPQYFQQQPARFFSAKDALLSFMLDRINRLGSTSQKLRLFSKVVFPGELKNLFLSPVKRTLVRLVDLGPRISQISSVVLGLIVSIKFAQIYQQFLYADISLWVGRMAPVIGTVLTKIPHCPSLLIRGAIAVAGAVSWLFAHPLIFACVLFIGGLTIDACIRLCLRLLRIDRINPRIERFLLMSWLVSLLFCTISICIGFSVFILSKEAGRKLLAKANVHKKQYFKEEAERVSFFLRLITHQVKQEREIPLVLCKISF